MRSFFVKIKALDVPNEIGRPKSSAEWEGGHLIAPAATRLTGRKKPKTSVTDDPKPGDQLLIYVDANQGAGGGLTAVATVEAAFLDGKRRRLKISGVSLFEKPCLTFVGPKNDRRFARGEIDIPAQGFLKVSHEDRRNKTLQMELGNLDDVVAVLAQLEDGSLQHDQSGRIIVQPRTKSIDGKLEIRDDQLSKRDEKLLSHDLAPALEGETDERKRTIRKRVAKVAREFILGRASERTLLCDHCDFDPTLKTNGTAVKPRSLLDVHHVDPLNAGVRLTTVNDFRLLCPTCHRFAHALMSAARDRMKRRFQA